MEETQRTNAEFFPLYRFFKMDPRVLTKRKGVISSHIVQEQIMGPKKFWENYSLVKNA